MTTFNLALLLVAVSIAILIAAIAYNSKSKETLRQAKRINNDALVSIKEAERERNNALRRLKVSEDFLALSERNASELKMEVATLKDNIHALSEEIINTAIAPTFRIEESEEIVRVMADFTALNFDKTLPLIVREFEKADNLSLAWAKANKLLTALKK